MYQKQSSNFVGTHRPPRFKSHYVRPTSQERRNADARRKAEQLRDELELKRMWEW